MTYARAIANNDVVLLAWDPGGSIPRCLGFDVRRREVGKSRRSLPAWVGFAGDDPKSAPRTTAEWPVQKYTWRDLTARPGATYIYEIVPMIGTPGSLHRSTPVLTSNPVTPTPQCSPHVSAYFNRGILATQHLARLLPKDGSGLPDAADLVKHLSTPGDTIRVGLADDILPALLSLLNRAKTENGHCYAALYELDDPELITALTDPAHLTLLLSNAGDGPERDSTNAAARIALRTAGVPITDRMLGSSHIGHNKFVVYCDPAGTPRAVLTGSTN